MWRRRPACRTAPLPMFSAAPRSCARKCASGSRPPLKSSAMAAPTRRAGCCAPARSTRSASPPPGALSYFFDDPFARVVMAGIAQACDRTGAGISLVSAVNEEQLAWNIQSALVDGFIVFCIEGGSRLVELTRERSLPFVALDFGFDDETISSLGVDDVAGARLAARHLAGSAIGASPCCRWNSPRTGHGPASYERSEAAIYAGYARPHCAAISTCSSELGIDRPAVPIYETLNDEASTTGRPRTYLRVGAPADRYPGDVRQDRAGRARMAGRARHLGARRCLDRRLRRRARRRASDRRSPRSPSRWPRWAAARSRRSSPSTARSAARRWTSSWSSGDRRPRLAARSAKPPSSPHMPF